MNQNPIIHSKARGMPANKLAVSLAEADTDTCLRTLETLAPAISLAEIRLDLMASFDLPRLIASAPCPLIITCRPLREGGRFSGPETERLELLRQAMRLGCAYVDVEWDSFAALGRPDSSSTRLIVSRHWMDQMPSRLFPAYEALREQADIVKLVGLACRPADMLPVFEVLCRAASPVIALAMGPAGQLTRLLAPCFPNCFLTYAAPAAGPTAPGQLSIDVMSNLYHVQHAGPQTAIHLHLCTSTASAQEIIQQNTLEIAGEVLHVPLVISSEEASHLLPGLKALLQHLTITADPALALLI